MGEKTRGAGASGGGERTRGGGENTLCGEGRAGGGDVGREEDIVFKSLWFVGVVCEVGDDDGFCRRRAKETIRRTS